jgi:hypothetical protein
MRQAVAAQVAAYLPLRVHPLPLEVVDRWRWRAWESC